MGPGNWFQGMNSASLCSLAGRYDNPLPPRFLAPIASLKIPALVSKNAGESTILWVTACEKNIWTSRNPNQISATLSQIFSSNKSAQASRKKGIYANRAGGWIHFWMKRLRTLKSFFRYSKVNLKIQKPIAVDVLFKACRLSNGTTLMQIQSSRTKPVS
jgi:hypothetical protein